MWRWGGRGSAAVPARGEAVESLAGRAGARTPARLRLRFSERRLLLTALDLGALLVALYVWLALRVAPAFDPRALLQQPQWYLILAVLWLVMASACDAYEPRNTRRVGPSVMRAAQAGVLAAAAYLLVPHLTPPLPSSRNELLSLPALVLVCLAVERTLHTLAFPRPAFRQPTLIIGTGQPARLIAATLAEAGDESYQVVGFIADEPRAADEDGPAPGPVLGTPADLPAVIARQDVSALILAPVREVDSMLLATLLQCVEQGVELVPMPALYERLTGRVPVEQVRDDWYVAIPVEQLTLSSVQRLTKRALDVVLAGLGVLCLAVLLPIVALAIRLDSPGPIFYVQPRVGIGGRVFRTFKFRSMVAEAEPDGAVWARRGDPRVTRVGRVLRATHVDEFPQLLNVLRGEMSAVGPRPERPEFVEKLAAELPLYRLRHVVKPGMAGWGLVQQGYAGSEQDVLVRLQYDLYYIKHQSLALDLVILLKTIAHALAFRGR